MALILASASPRRQELLQKVTADFLVKPANIDERVRESETPEAYVERMAFEKANHIRQERQDDVIIGCDTIVVDKGRILGKPLTEAVAMETLRSLSGGTHLVMTGMCVLFPNEPPIVQTEIVEVTMFDLTEKEITEYVATKEPLDKAGSYGIQGQGALLVKRIKGDYYSVMGLPIGQLNQLLKARELG